MNEYMNAPTILKRPKKSNSYGEYTDFINMQIKARVQFRDEMITDSTGKDVLSLGVVYSPGELKTNDRLIYKDKEYTITKTSEFKDLFGTVQYYKGYLI